MPKQRPGKSRQDFGTPKEFLAATKRLLGLDTFSIDLAASKHNAVVPRYFDEEDDSLVQNWNTEICGGPGWLNPPYADIYPWAKKCATSNAYITMLVPAATDTEWFRDWVWKKSFIYFLTQRIKFVGATDLYPKGLLLAVYGVGIGEDFWRWRDDIP
jgi:phage N-6-adenine-methyltransferase